MCQRASRWGEKGKPISGVMIGVQNKNWTYLVNCLFGGCEARKEKQSLFQVSQNWLAKHSGNTDYWIKCRWAGQNKMVKTTAWYTYKACTQIQLRALSESSHIDSDLAIGHRDTYLYIHWVKWTTHTTSPHKIKHILKHPQEWCQSLHSVFF